MPPESLTVREASPTFTNSKHHWRAELSLHTEPVSGFSVVSAVSAALLTSTAREIFGTLIRKPVPDVLLIRS